MAEDNLSVMERIAFDTVREIQDIKRSEGCHPDYAALEEIMNSLKTEVLESLRSLYSKGLITHHHNINGISLFGTK